MEDPREEEAWFRAHRKEIEEIQNCCNCTMYNPNVNIRPLSPTVSNIDSFSSNSFDSLLALIVLTMLIDETDKKEVNDNGEISNKR